MQNKNGLAYLLLIFATLFWSGNFIVGKAASIYQIPPFSLNFYRWFFAGLILLPFTYKEIINSFDYIKSKMSPTASKSPLALDFKNIPSAL